MAGKVGKAPRRRIRYFYVKVEGIPHLHKVLYVNRSSDLVWAWDYTEDKRVMYVWSDVRKTMQHAYSITEVANLLGMHRMTIDSYIRDGKIKTPQRIYRLENKTPGRYMFSEDDILDMHQYMSEVHRGRPRKDGMIKSQVKINASELRTLVQQGQVLYTTDEQGQFVPIWKEQVW